MNAAQSANASGNTQLLSDLTNNTPTQADLTALGITPAQWATLSGQLAQDATETTANANTNLGDENVAVSPTQLNLSQYLTQSPVAVSAANEATAQDYANVAALNSLLGANAPVEPINASTAAEAGTAPTIASQNAFNLAGAEEAAQLDPIESQAQALSTYANWALGQYNNNGHFGGQTPQQMATFITDINGAIENLNNQAAQIANTAAQSNPAAVPTVPAGTNDTSIAEQVGGDLASFGNTIGSYFSGLAHGGEVEPKNLKAYLGGC